MTATTMLVDHYVFHSIQFDVAADIVNREMLFIMGVTCLVRNANRAGITSQLSRIVILNSGFVKFPRKYT